MGHVLHGSARTTQAVRAAMQRNEESLQTLAQRHGLLPLDDCLYALQATIPRLSRSALHRCFQRHGISRLPLPGGDGEPPKKKQCKDNPVG